MPIERWAAGEGTIARIKHQVDVRPQSQTLAATPELRKRASEGGSLAIKGTLRYQACDEAICYLPVTLPLAWTVKLASGK